MNADADGESVAVTILVPSRRDTGSRTARAARRATVQAQSLRSLAQRYGAGHLTTGLLCSAEGLRHWRHHQQRFQPLSCERRLASARRALIAEALRRGGGTHHVARLVLTETGWWASVGTPWRASFHDVPAPFFAQTQADPRPRPAPKHTARESLTDATAAAKASGADGALLMTKRGDIREGATFHIAVPDGAGFVVPSVRSFGTAECFLREHRVVRAANLSRSDVLKRGAVVMNALLGFAPLARVDGHITANYDASFVAARTLSRLFFGR